MSPPAIGSLRDSNCKKSQVITQAPRELRAMALGRPGMRRQAIDSDAVDIRVTTVLNGSARLSRCLPGLYPRHLMNEHHDIEEKIIANPQSKPGLDRDPGHDRHGRRSPRSKQEACHGGQRVAERIDDSIAIIADGDGGRAISLDDERAVLDDLPCRLKQNGEAQSRANGPMLEDEPQEKVKPKAVQQVRERVPVRQMLRIPGPERISLPEFYIAARADRQPPHQMQRQRLHRQDRYDEPGLR